MSAADSPAARMTGFVQHLRLNGLELGLEQSRLALEVAAGPELVPMPRARAQLKVLLTSRRSEWERFDDLFEAYFRGAGRVRQRAQSAAATKERRHSRSTTNLWGDRLRTESITSADGAGEGSGNDDGDDHLQDTGQRRVRRTASAAESLRRADLRHVADRDEMAAAEALAVRLARAMRYRLSRRYRAAHRGRRIDLRRTARDSLGSGGDPVRLYWRCRVDRPVRLVVLLDVSGSMQPYVRYLLQFLRGLSLGWRETDAYLFNTRLTRITDVLREKDAILAMSRLSLMAAGFGGGTRLSESLEAFNAHYAKRALNSRSVFIVVSDGYDTGDTQAAVKAFARLRRRARRVVWLNPAMGGRDYAPTTRTMAALLPFIDELAPAHSLDALSQLERRLSRL